jgi:hypothetical protein
VVRPVALRCVLSLALAAVLSGCGLFGLGHVLVTGDLPNRHARLAVTNADAATLVGLAFRESPDAEAHDVDVVVPPGVVDAQVVADWDGAEGYHQVLALLADGRQVELPPVAVTTDGEAARVVVPAR